MSLLMFTVSVASVGRELSGQVCRSQAALQQAVQTSCSGQQADSGPTQPGKRVLTPAQQLLCYKGFCSACAAVSIQPSTFDTTQASPDLKGY